MAVGEQVRAVANPEQEVDGVFQLRDLRFREHVAGDEIAHRPHAEAHLRHPHGGVQVAEPALPVLQLGLEQVDRIARLLIAFAGQCVSAGAKNRDHNPNKPSGFEVDVPPVERIGSWRLSPYLPRGHWSSAT